MKLFNYIIQVSMLSGVLLFTGPYCIAAHAAEGYEPQQDLTASDVLPKSFFESDLYQVDPKVKNDGLMNKYLFGHVKAWQL